MPFLYTNSLDKWAAWETTPAQWLITTSHSMVDVTVQTWVSDIAAEEVTVPGYARQAVTGQTRTVDTTLNRITYDCDDPDFGTLASGDPYLSLLVLAYQGTDDSDSLLLASYQLNYTTTDPSDVNPAISPAGVHWAAQK